MYIIKSFFVVSILLLGLSGCETFTKTDLSKSASNSASNSTLQTVTHNESCQCYWMENYSGYFKWVSTESVQGMKRNITKTECFKLDSCDGGLGHSNGGCYKWALRPESTRIPW